MILTGQAISEAVLLGEIVFTPFNEQALNPNSINYRLGPTLRHFTTTMIDARHEPDMTNEEIPQEGIVLHPGKTYLGTTLEIIGSDFYVPSLIGRSSLGRLGVFLQVSADLGNLGAIHRWTLEIVVCQPIRIYPGMVVGQVTFWSPFGEKSSYSGSLGNYSMAVLPDPNQYR